MLLATMEYIEIGNQAIYLMGQIYHILVFFIISLVVYIIYKLFNIFY